MKGWIKIHRKIIESKWGRNLEMLGFWVYILSQANHKDAHDADGILIKKGSFKSGRKKISKELSLSESKVERMLSRLEIEQQIEQQKTTKYRIISITKWDCYQEDEQGLEQQVNNKRTTSEQQVNTNKNDKNDKNDKNEKNSNTEPVVDGGEKHYRENMIADFWNIIAEDYNLPKVKTPLASDRIKKVQLALKEFSEREDWEKIILEIPKNKFNLGENDRAWKANFDWLFRTKNCNYRKLWEAANG